VTKGLLQGKTIAMKDNIAVKDVPMLMGSDFVRDFTPVNAYGITTPHRIETD
jgi:Asp-tRNA(Asn)/Glu-tRNA(Gln) amidotransferase A subunit family amidase